MSRIKACVVIAFGIVLGSVSLSGQTGVHAHENTVVNARLQSARLQPV